jgi:Flp pilus assembly protein TadD
MKPHARAIQQLPLAVDLQPNDAETHQMLIASLDDVDVTVLAANF